MLSPEDQQVQICLLKANLEEIENSLVVQRSALPELDAENEQQYRETKTALRISRAQNQKIEQLKQENVRLTAKRTQVKRQCDSLEEAMKTAREARSQLTNLVKEQESTDEHNIRNYEDSLRDKAERFRQTRRFYDEEQMTREFEKVNSENSDLEKKTTRQRNVVSDLKLKLETLKPDVPENLPAIVGKMELHEKWKLLTNNCEDLRLKLKELNKKESSITIT